MAAGERVFDEFRGEEVPFKTLVPLTARAFEAYPVWNYVFGEGPNRVSHLEVIFGLLLHLCTFWENAFYYVLSIKNGDSKITAAAGNISYIEPTGSKGESLLAYIAVGFARVPFIIGFQRTWKLHSVGSIVEHWHLHDTKSMKDGHWYLQDVAVEPHLQGQGLGFMLVKKIVDDSFARKKIPIYLQKLGFHVVSEGDISSDIKQWNMVHDSYPAESNSGLTNES